MLTRKTKYALRAMACLAREPAGHGQSAATIAAHEQLPRKFLERILQDLNRSGFVTSRKGREGGYALAGPATSLRVADIVRRMDGPLAPVPCVSRTAYRPCGDCKSEASCAIRIAMARVRDETARILDGTSLADAASEELAAA